VLPFLALVEQEVLPSLALVALLAYPAEQVVRPSQALEEQEVLPSLALVALLACRVEQVVRPLLA
jgi:hypothetical protein